MAVYKLWQARPNEAWHQLSPEEQQGLLGRVLEALNSAGGKQLVLCDASWADEEWPLFGVAEFPDIAAEQHHQVLLAEINWGRYLRSRSTLGTEWTPPGLQ